MGEEHPGGSALSAGLGAAGRDVTGVGYRPIQCPLPGTTRSATRYYHLLSATAVAPSIHRPSDIQAPQQSLSGSLTRDTCESIGLDFKVEENSVWRNNNTVTVLS